MATKSYTTIEQSRKLAEILPLESADMTYYACVKDWRGNPVEPKWGKPTTLTKEELALPRPNFQEYEYVPCWSLAALFSTLPRGCNISTPKPNNALGYCCWNQYHEIYASNPIDACYEMIIKLHDLKLL